MKIKEGFDLRDVCGEKVVIPCGAESVNFNCLIHLNETGTFLWQEASRGKFSVDSLCDSLLLEYEVDSETAFADVQSFVDRLIEHNLID